MCKKHVVLCLSPSGQLSQSPALPLSRPINLETNELYNVEASRSAERVSQRGTREPPSLTGPRLLYKRVLEAICMVFKWSSSVIGNVGCARGALF